MNYVNETGLKKLITLIKSSLKSKSDIGHTHNYAGSSSAGGRPILLNLI